MPKWLKTISWFVTGLAALLLIVVSVRIAVENSAGGDVEIPARVMGNAMFVQLHEEPHVTASITSMVERYTSVMIVDAHFDGQSQWFKIEWEGEPGWTVSSNLELVDP